MSDDEPEHFVRVVKPRAPWPVASSSAPESARNRWQRLQTEATQYRRQLAAVERKTARYERALEQLRASIAMAQKTVALLATSYGQQRKQDAATLEHLRASQKIIAAALAPRSYGSTISIETVPADNDDASA